LGALVLGSVVPEEAPILVVEVFRHGARGPEMTQFDQDKYWGVNAGQLTPGGQRMHYLLGVALKEQYPTLLKKYNPEKIYARSTDVNRTIMSVYAHMYGIFEANGPPLADNVVKEEAIPPFKSEIIQKTVETLDNAHALPNSIQPVPIHVTTEANDNVLRPWSACPQANTWYNDGMVDRESRSVFDTDMKDTVKSFNDKNIKVNNVMELYALADLSITNKFQGIPLPGKITLDSQEFKDLNFFAEWVTIKSVDLFEDQISLYALGLLNNIYDFLNGRANGTNALDFVFLSGHDTSLLNLLIPFGITNKTCFRENYKNIKAKKEVPFPECQFPTYASNLIFELYEKPEPYLVFKYNGKPLQFCGKDKNKCTLPEFASFIKKATKSYTQSDFQEKCALNTDQRNYLWLIILFVVCFGLGIGLLAIRKDLKQKEKELSVQPTQGGEYYLGK